KIVSLLPSATEIVYALGLGDDLVGVTDECDYPPDAVTKPVVSRSALPQGRPLSSREIDEAVRERVDVHEPLYILDRDLLRREPGGHRVHAVRLLPGGGRGGGHEALPASRLRRYAGREERERVRGRCHLVLLAAGATDRRRAGDPGMGRASGGVPRTTARDD